LFLSLFAPGGIFAATQSLTVDSVPLSIDQAQEFTVNVNFSCSSCSTDSYLRGVFYPSGSSYFGYTQDNSGNWSNAPGGGCTTYFKIAQSDLSSGTWSGTLKVKPDIASSYYNGPGEYLFKVGRYTPSCPSASVWSTEATISITGPTPTPTPAPTNTPTPTTVATPTSTPKLTATPTLKPTPSVRAQLVATNAGILGESSISAEINTPTPLPAIIKIASEKSNNLLPKILIFIGIIFLVACVIVIFYPYVKDKLNRNKDE
jgi:hypothetical protein